MTNSFKNIHTLDERKNESEKIRNKYENRIPVIVTKDPKSSLKYMDKNKFLAPNDLSLGQFLYVIRKRLELNEAETLYVFVNETILAPTSQSMSQLYNSYKDEDGFLYLMYCSENVFG